MTTQLDPPIHPFTDWIQTTSSWIQATDDHAAHHLALLERVGLVLDRGGSASPEERRRLAAKLERYRYQHFNEHAHRWSAEHEALVDRLDLAANRLAGRQGRPPRAARHAVNHGPLDSASIDKAMAVLDPSVPLDRIAQQAAELTQVHFAASDGGDPPAATRRRMLLYAPLYVSNECVNYCTYCGFRYPLDIVRKQLTVAEAVAQARILHAQGFRHVLLVGGDFPGRTTASYYGEVVAAIMDLGIRPAIEIAPQTTDTYEALVTAGTCGLTLYQETYDERRYAEYHFRGPKASFQWRLEGHDRAAEAGVGRLGLGILLGLAEPREDLRAMLRHAGYLASRFPDRTLAFSLPRIHDAPDGFRPPYVVSDDDLIRLYCALRIALPTAELVLSTREPIALRNRLARICITQMSAGSSTAPGGYGADIPPAGQQFPVSDYRRPLEMTTWLEQEGFQTTRLPEELSKEARQFGGGPVSA